MAQFSIAIADEDVNRVMDAVAANYSRPATVVNPDYDPGQPSDPTTNPETIPNPENKFVFTNRMVRQFLSDHVKAHEINVAKAAAEAALNTTIDISDPQV